MITGTSNYFPRSPRWLWVELIPGAVASVTAWSSAYGLNLVGAQTFQGKTTYQFSVSDTLTDGDFLSLASEVAASPAVSFVTDGYASGNPISTPPVVVTTSPVATAAKATFGVFAALVLIGLAMTILK